MKAGLGSVIEAVVAAKTVATLSTYGIVEAADHLRLKKLSTTQTSRLSDTIYSEEKLCIRVLADIYLRLHALDELVARFCVRIESELVALPRIA
jgi:hypothetical protein